MNYSARWVAICLATFFLVSRTEIVGNSAQLNGAIRADPTLTANNQLIVKPVHGDLEQLHLTLGTEVLYTIPELDGMQIVKLPINFKMEKAVEAFLKSDQVQYAEPDYVMHLRMRGTNLMIQTLVQNNGT
ncbi:MAG: hypothetical protein H8E20_00155 [Verrucomicrobia bacterium]|nr:hypothetical protein [Verrucomicrobiota bacterium]